MFILEQKENCEDICSDIFKNSWAATDSLETTVEMMNLDSSIWPTQNFSLYSGILSDHWESENGQVRIQGSRDLCLD